MYSHDFGPKMIGDAYPLVLQQNSEQSNENQAATTCTNMNLMPNQREENLTTAKASLKSFLFNTMILKSKDSVFSYLHIQFLSSLFDNLVLRNSEFQELDQQLCRHELTHRDKQEGVNSTEVNYAICNVCLEGDKKLLNFSTNWQH